MLGCPISRCGHCTGFSCSIFWWHSVCHVHYGVIYCMVSGQTRDLRAGKSGRGENRQIRAGEIFFKTASTMFVFLLCRSHMLMCPSGGDRVGAGNIRSRSKMNSRTDAYFLGGGVSVDLSSSEYTWYCIAYAVFVIVTIG